MRKISNIILSMVAVLFIVGCGSSGNSGGSLNSSDFRTYVVNNVRPQNSPIPQFSPVRIERTQPSNPLQLEDIFLDDSRIDPIEGLEYSSEELENEGIKISGNDLRISSEEKNRNWELLLGKGIPFEESFTDNPSGKHYYEGGVQYYDLNIDPKTVIPEKEVNSELVKNLVEDSHKDGVFTLVMDFDTRYGFMSLDFEESKDDHPKIPIIFNDLSTMDGGYTSDFMSDKRTLPVSVAGTFHNNGVYGVFYPNQPDYKKTGGFKSTSHRVLREAQ